MREEKREKREGRERERVRADVCVCVHILYKSWDAWYYTTYKEYSSREFCFELSAVNYKADKAGGFGIGYKLCNRNCTDLTFDQRYDIQMRPISS